MASKSKTQATAKVIGLWLDEMSDSDRPAWIVSRDLMNTRGEAETTDTVEWRNLDDHDNAYEQALEAALELARKEGLCVIRTESGDRQRCIYAPRVIQIQDGMGHLQETLRLHGDTLDGTDWVVDILQRNGCQVDDEMDNDDIATEVREAFAGDEDYDGDPDENGLSVTVRAEKSIIDG